MLSVFLDHTYLTFWDKKKVEIVLRALKNSIVHSTIEHARTTWGLWDGLVGKGLASEAWGQDFDPQDPHEKENQRQAPLS